MSEKIERSVARVVLRVPVVHPKNNQKVGNEVALTMRPGWSNLGRYAYTLPGGKIETADFAAGIAENITPDQMQSAGIRAAVRELSEELGITLSHQLLQFVLCATNESNWTTYVYAADLESKPQLLVLPESAGTLWLPESELLSGTIPLFADHGAFVVAALQLLSNT
ncbi:MAG: NUDIX hydrolase [Candidatus Pacebacteria bacterium]|nr:NUDIX hydrolase [Candidatus Paceibacterota bacterium]PIR63747.1 MAG: hypothetical protein COU64_02115 [Candidatus Pacebacteria bacterium CG10_big_fil_rev_8_21_14_0_10_40_26]PIZ78533.1 MAG: hypothetical protein COY01_04800 [Candidatus Pacebacteria bacterium CG_4_10_14_0_2_um_filter_40_20]PJA69384.1 MAG: hypothetical protein CO156_00690 [Candidatus Pacebacteria bacterium CG_4_9_14_3_um_filter_40_12]PJC41401.1 MAG: hypothetical protein CO041_04675 [Candidatus Pacebacteria bacterium CG_4_9_14_0_